MVYIQIDFCIEKAFAIHAKHTKEFRKIFNNCYRKSFVHLFVTLGLVNHYGCVVRPFFICFLFLVVFFCVDKIKQINYRANILTDKTLISIEQICDIQGELFKWVE